MDLLAQATPALLATPDKFEEADRLLEQLVDQRVDLRLREREAEKERNREVDSVEAAAIIKSAPYLVLRLRRRGVLPGRRTPGTRHYYFKVGDLQDWLAKNTRSSDGGRKHTKRTNALGTKRRAG